nr:immunoglobulin heavy chain junction region [Mus musculus]
CARGGVTGPSMDYW